MFISRDPFDATPHLKVIFLCFSLLSIVSCSDSNEPLSSDCSLATDTVSVIDKVTVEGVTYYLVLRIAGWHDKTEIVEVYDTEPSFNECAQSSTTPIYEDSLEMDQTVSHVFLDSESKSVEIQYTPGAPKKHHNINLKLEIKRPDAQ